MYQLNSRDTQALLLAIEELNSDVDPRTLSARALGVLDAVIGNDLSNFDFFSPDGRYNLTAWTSRQDVADSPVLESFRQFVHQHPAIPLAIADSKGNPFKVTDGVRQSTFENTELYNEYFRKIDIDHQMGLAMPVASDLTVCCAVARAARDFSEREREIMRLAAPHLLNAIRNAIAYERLNSALETSGCGVISIDSTAKAQFISEFAEKLLEAYFAGEVRLNGLLPETLLTWVQRGMSGVGFAFDPATNPFRVENTSGALSIRLVLNGKLQEATLLLEEKKFLSPSRFKSADLTARESETLYWIVGGKTNGEIGVLCDISKRTVQKHVENLYRKLGVETRIAAMLRALEILH